MNKTKVIISGGGTGGHIFPAIAIANALKKSIVDIDILFVGAKGKMEMEKVPAAGYMIEGLNISGLQRSMSLKNISFPFKVISSILYSRKLIKRFKPDVVVGVGGFASGPLLFAATFMKIPSVIQEQNFFPGMTNKILSKRVNKICVAFEGMGKYFPNEKLTVTGNPIREDMVNIAGKRDEALEFFKLDTKKITILFIGGSLGARTINQSVEDNLVKFNDKNYQVIWQTGKWFYKQACDSVESCKLSNVKTFEFIYRMDLAYAAADIIISRAGAISISELAIIGKPCIFIPSPNVAEDHQTKNALNLVEKNAALMVIDTDAREKLESVLINLIEDKETQNILSQNISRMAIKNAADKIVDVIKSIIK